MQGSPGAHAVSTHFQLQAGVAIEVGTKTWRALGGWFRIRVRSTPRRKQERLPRGLRGTLR